MVLGRPLGHGGGTTGLYKRRGRAAEKKPSCDGPHPQGRWSVLGLCDPWGRGKVTDRDTTRVSLDGLKGCWQDRTSSLGRVGGGVLGLKKSSTQDPSNVLNPDPTTGISPIPPSKKIAFCLGAWCIIVHGNGRLGEHNLGVVLTNRPSIPGRGQVQASRRGPTVRKRGQLRGEKLALGSTGRPPLGLTPCKFRPHPRPPPSPHLQLAVLLVEDFRQSLPQPPAPPLARAPRPLSCPWIPLVLPSVIGGGGLDGHSVTVSGMELTWIACPLPLPWAPPRGPAWFRHPPPLPRAVERGGFVPLSAPTPVYHTGKIRTTPPPSSSSSFGFRHLPKKNPHLGPSLTS